MSLLPPASPNPLLNDVVDSCVDSCYDSDGSPTRSRTPSQLDVAKQDFSSEHSDVCRSSSDTLAGEIEDEQEAMAGLIEQAHRTGGQLQRVIDILAECRSIGQSEPSSSELVKFSGREKDYLSQCLKRSEVKSTRNIGDEAFSRNSDDGDRTSHGARDDADRMRLSHGTRRKMENSNENLRHVVIDGSNVALTHGVRGVFSCRGIQIAVDWFVARSHKVTVFVPGCRKEAPRVDWQVDQQQILRKLEQDGVLSFTPARRVDGKRIVCYDDRYILKYATKVEGIVVSNDHFRDLLDEFREVVEKRLLMYTFVGDDFLPPDDPLGRDGPHIDDFLLKVPRLPPAELCPYGKKCTFGIKCKYFHPGGKVKRVRSHDKRDRSGSPAFDKSVGNRRTPLALRTTRPSLPRNVDSPCLPRHVPTDRATGSELGSDHCNDCTNGKDKHSISQRQQHPPLRTTWSDPCNLSSFLRSGHLMVALSETKKLDESTRHKILFRTASDESSIVRSSRNFTDSYQPTLPDVQGTPQSPPDVIAATSVPSTMLVQLSSRIGSTTTQRPLNFPRTPPPRPPLFSMQHRLATHALLSQVPRMPPPHTMSSSTRHAQYRSFCRIFPEPLVATALSMCPPDPKPEELCRIILSLQDEQNFSQHSNNIQQNIKNVQPIAVLANSEPIKRP